MGVRQVQWRSHHCHYTRYAAREGVQDERKDNARDTVEGVAEDV
jgi:hypothetical protein